MADLTHASTNGSKGPGQTQTSRPAAADGFVRKLKKKAGGAKNILLRCQVLNQGKLSVCLSLNET
jgi:hypothetical protein